MKKLTCILFLILSIHIIAIPNHSVSTINVAIGDVITYSIKLPPGLLLELNLPTLNGFETIDSTVEKTADYYAYKYQLQVFSIDNLRIPSMSLTAINGMPPVDFSPINFNITSLISPTMNELNNIAPLFSIFFIQWNYILIGLLVLVLILTFYYLFSKKMKPDPLNSLSNQQVENPYKVAEKQLKELMKSLKNEQSVIKRAYFKLTEVLFTYLTNKLGLNLLDSTTAEAQRLLKQKKPFSNEIIIDIINLAKEMDHYKFSKDPLINLENIKATILKAHKIIKKVENDS